MPTRLLSEETRGVYVISATPFTEDGALDHEGVPQLLDFYLRQGVHGLTILGMMGEAHKLTTTEAMDFTTEVLQYVAGRVPVVVGVSSSGTKNMALLADHAMAAGAAGVMVTPISGLKTEEQVHAFFEAVFAELDPKIPVCIQDYPQSTGVTVSVATITRLADDFPRFVVFKHEDCPGLGKLSRLRKAWDGSGRRVAILVGNGGLYCPQELRRGADGIMTGFAFPEMLVQVYERFVAGDAEGAEDLFDLYLPLVRHEQQPGFGLAVRKEILHRRGALRSPAVRQPGPRLSREDHQELDALLRRLERRLGTGRT